MAVTPESNLALIEELQELVGASTYEPVDGPEFSYPAVGQAVDDEMWQWVTRAVGSGIFATGGYPYWLRNLGSSSETNSRNQMRLTVDNITGDAQAIFNGFYHKLVEDMRLDFPMPLSETTYYVVLELNPLKARSPEGPISVQVYPNELNTESGREHLILWSVTRKPNQLLTDAEIVRYRPRASPTFTVTDRDHLPDPKKALYGTVAFIHGVHKDIVIAKGLDAEEGGATRWESLLESRWESVGYGATYRYPGHGSTKSIARRGSRRTLRGRWEIASGGRFTAPSSNGYLLWNLEEDDRPFSEERRLVVGYNLASPAIGVVNISATSGEVRFHPTNNTTWVDIGELSYTAQGLA